MKFKALTGTLLLAFSVILSGCSTTTSVRSTKRTTSTTKVLPPGQAKKAAGAKSAKAYAPGHNKG